jgi:hypothetical protein
MSYLEGLFHATEEENRRAILKLLACAPSARLLQCRRVGFYPAPLPVARVLCRLFPVYAAYLTCKVRHSGR